MGEAWLVMGLAPLLLGAWAVARFGFRIEPGFPRILATSMLAWGWVTVGMEILGTQGFLDQVSLVAWSVGGLVLGGSVAIARRGVIDPPSMSSAEEPSSLDLAASVATFLVLAASIRLGLTSFLQPVKVVSDGPIYHLYFAARWWKAGRIFLVATPFGEVGAPYFWGNGELWYTWLMAIFGGDRYAKLGQVPFLALAGVAVEAIARHLKVGASASRMAAVWFVTLGPAFILGFEPNVDNILVAGYLTAIYFFLRAFTATESPTPLRFLLLGSISAGLGMGTKPTGIVFFPPLLVIVAVAVGLRDRRTMSRVLVGIISALVPALAMMVFWPARNAVLTGNPLYPIHVEAFGVVWLSGWFGPGAMTESLYYVPKANWQAFVDIMMQVIDPRQFPVWFAAAIGLWAFRRPRGEASERDRSTIDRWVWFATALAVFNLLAYWFVIPYRTQQRFSVPALALFTVSLAKLFDRAGWIRGVAVGLLLIHLITPEPWPIANSEATIPWDFLTVIPNYVPSPIDFPINRAALLTQLGNPRFWTTLLVAIGSTFAVRLWYRPARSKGQVRTWTRSLVGWSILMVFTFAAGWSLQGDRSDPFRLVLVPFPLFQDYNDGWAALEQRAGPQGARVAYAGNKIPYYLMGSKLQNDVKFINVDQHRDWLLHDYHRNAAHEGQPTTWPNPFPGWDRLKPDYDAWLANLRAEKIDLLVVTRVNVEEGAQNAGDTDLFPIERYWAEHHPETFRTLFGSVQRGDRLKIFQVLPPQ